MDFSHVPAAKRRAALEQRIPLDSPFAQPGFWVHWHEGVAHLWLWDQVIQDDLRDQVQDTNSIKFIPESAYTDMGIDGGQLWQSSEGYIAQYWQDFQLIGESWWSESPSNDQWRIFLHALAQQESDAPEPRVLEIEGGIPWKAGGFGQISLASERTIMMSMAVLFALVLTFQLTGIGRLAINNALLDREIHTLEPEIEQTIAARDHFFELRNNNLQYQSLAGLKQLEMMSDITDILTARGATLAEWNFQDQALEMRVTDEAPDLNQYVQALEALGWLSEIRIDKARHKSQIIIHTELVESL